MLRKGKRKAESEERRAESGERRAESGERKCRIGRLRFWERRSLV